MPKYPYSPALSARLPPERRGGHSEHELYTPQIALWMYFSPSTIHSSHPDNPQPNTAFAVTSLCLISQPAQSLQRLCRCAAPAGATPVLGRAARRGRGGGGSPSTRCLGSRAEPSRRCRQVGKPGVGPCWSRGVILGEILPLVSLRSPQHMFPLAHLPPSSQSRTVLNIQQIKLESS